MSDRRGSAPQRRAPRSSGNAPSRHPVQRKATRGRRKPSWLKAQLTQRPLPVWVLVVADVLVFAVAINAFALFHFVLPRKEQAVGTTSQRATAAPVAQAPDLEGVSPTVQPLSPEATVQAEPVQSDPEGYFGTKFADKFTDGTVENVDHSYRSANLNVTLTDYRYRGVDFHVVDFYLRDISSLQAGFAKDSFGRGMYESVSDIVSRMHGIAGINGDYYGGRSDGVVARNGTLYRNDDHLKRDVCVLYWDGRMETYSPEGFDAEAEMANGAYQIWNFGPMLLDQNGQPMEEFNSDVNPSNPRTVLGYFEPGHYCFVAVDGRSDASPGLTLKNLSLMAQVLGCTRAYNLDGGDSSVMVYNGKLANVPSQAHGGRKSSDVVAIVEP